MKNIFLIKKSILWELDKYVKDNANICYQIGNFINKDGSIFPLDFGFYKIFEELGIPKNRIIWHFGHGFHAKKGLADDMKQYFGIQKEKIIHSI